MLKACKDCLELYELESVCPACRSASYIEISPEKRDEALEGYLLRDIDQLLGHPSPLELDELDDLL